MSNTLIPGSAHIYIGATGTVAPTAPGPAIPGTGWYDVGNTVPDSLQLADNPTFITVASHQSDYAVRIAQTGTEAHLTVDLEDFTAQNLVAAYGGGTVTTITPYSAGPPIVPGVYRFAPPAVGGRASMSVIADFIDGSRHYRLIIPVVFQDSALTLKLAKTANSTLPLALAVQGTNGVDPYYILTDDPLWIPSSVTVL